MKEFIPDRPGWISFYVKKFRVKKLLQKARLKQLPLRKQKRLKKESDGCSQVQNKAGDPEYYCISTNTAFSDMN